MKFLVFLFFVSALAGCSRSAEELPLVPPATHPLSREFIGYGVVSASFTHLLNEPGPAGVSLGYLRRGTVVRIIERRPFTARGSTVSWVYAEGNYEEGNASGGWLEENNLEVYDTETQAITASRSMSL